MLERVVAVGGALRLVGEPEMGLDSIRAKDETLAPLDRSKAVKAVPVVVPVDELFLKRQDLLRRSLTPESSQSLCLAKPCVAAERPLGRIDGRSQGSERPARITPRNEHAAFLERQLALDAGKATFQQVIHLRPEPPGDHPEDASRGLAASELDLVQEGAAEVIAADPGEAHAALLAHATDSLPERFVSGHCKALLYR
jgi:hypothetical protein